MPVKVLYSSPERNHIKFPPFATRVPALKPLCGKTEHLPLFANSINADGESCLETTFEGWKFAQDTQHYFHNGTNGVLKITISGPTTKENFDKENVDKENFGKENSEDHYDKENFDKGDDIVLMPGEVFQGKEWNCNFQVTTPDGKKVEAKGKINQQTEARYRYFYYANTHNELKVIKGEMLEGTAWSRWRPLELMVDP